MNQILSNLNILLNLVFAFRGAIATLYDRPPTHFRRLNVDEIHEVYY